MRSRTSSLLTSMSLSRGKLLPPLSQFVLNAKIQLLPDRINDQADQAEPHGQRRIDTGPQTDSQKGAFRLRYIRNITVEVEHPRAQRASQTQTGLECEKNSSVHKSGGTARGLPFRIISHVGNHDP